MSAVGDARQRPPAAIPTVTWPGRALRWLLGLVFLVLGIGLVGGAALAWRLAQGPLDITFLARRAETLILPGDGPARLSIGSASIAWNGFDRGADRGFALRLGNVRLVDGAGSQAARVDAAEVSVSLRRLLEGHVVPRQVALTGLRLRAVRAADGSMRLELAGLDPAAGDEQQADTGPSVADVLAELRQPAGTDQRQGARGLEALAQLQHIRLHDARLEVADRASAQTWRADVADLDLQRQGQGGVKGEAAAEIGAGGALASFQLKADLLPGGGTHLEATLAPQQSGAIAQTTTALAPLNAMKASLQATATLDLSPALLPRDGALHVAAGGGTISIARGTLGFEHLAVDAHAQWSGGSWRPTQVKLDRAQAVLPSPAGGWSTTLSATGEAVVRDGKVQATTQLSVDHLAFADLGGLWPEAWGGHTRPWLVENVTSGTVRDGLVTLKLSAPLDHPAAVEIAEASGTLQGDDVTIHWLRPVPPIEHAQAMLTVIGPDVVEIKVPSASQGHVGLSDGVVRFKGLTGKDQFMALTAAVHGPVAEVLQVLRNKRLHLFDKHPIGITSSAGTLVGKISVDMPMKKELKFEQLAISANGSLAALRLGGLVAGRDLERGEIHFDVDQDGLQASGQATVAGFSGAVDVAMNFRDGPPEEETQRASMSGKASAPQLRAADADPADVITAGEAAMNVVFSSQRDGKGRVEIKAGLAGAGLKLLGWTKPPGPAATLAGTLVLEHDKLAGISDIEARGPGLFLSAKAEMIGGKPLLLRFGRATLGRTQASGDIRFPGVQGEPIRARLAGNQLDLSAQLDDKAGGRGGQGGGTPWIADVKFERVLLAKGRVIAGVTAHAQDDGTKLTLVDAASTGPEQARLVIAPQGTGRRLQVRAADAGAIFQLLGVTETIHGGALALDAEYDDRAADPPLSGTLFLSDFSVNDGVAIGKLLQAITIYGIADAMSGEGVQFTRLVLPFRYDRKQLHIGETRAFSPSLGLTAQGWIDFTRHILDVRGTVVPAYALNSALGRIPLVGRLFSPERGGGLVSVNYSVTGNAGNPNILVNPLSALTPGFLRNLFNIFR